MLRRNWLAGCLSLLAAWFLGSAATAWTAEEVTLKERLQSGLRCRRPEEFAFVSDVADLVESGDLPLDLTLSTMQWAVKKNRHFPYFYFEYGLRQRAAEIGVSL